MNEFEQRLRKVPVQQIPADWRAEILSAARVGQASSLSNERASASRSTQRMAEDSRNVPFARLFSARLRSLFWPHPQAWAGLAAVWIIIAFLNFSQRDDSPMPVQNSAPPSPEMRVELQQQQQLLAELLGPHETGDADRPRMNPARPHTQIARTMMG